MPASHALIAGATGIVGRRIAEHLAARGWQVTGLCRHVPAQARACRYLSVDLTDAARCREQLAGLNDVTHVFYAARYDHPEGVAESVDVNAAMLENLIGAVEPVAQHLRHVHLVHGTKYYGHMLGPLAVPITESQPRARSPNFYFVHEDFIRARSRGQAWTYSTSRPHTFGDAAADEPRNVALLIAVYASVARALGEPLAYPGTEASFNVRTQFTHVPLLARAIGWMAESPCCANESYNVVNGDGPRWADLWPRFADYFGVQAGGAQPMKLAEHMAAREPAWARLVREAKLEPVALDSRVLWPYADYLFAPEWDIISSLAKARRDGFTESMDSAQMFLALFDDFRESGLIP